MTPPWFVEIKERQKAGLVSKCLQLVKVRREQREEGGDRTARGGALLEIGG